MENRNIKESQWVAGQYIKERDYWLEKLSGELEKTIFPHDEKVGDNHPLFEKVNFQFSRELYSRMMEIANKSDFRLHMVLIGGLILLLNKYIWTNNNDIMIGVPTYKQSVDGELINKALALRFQLKNNISCKDLLLKVGQTVFEANENQNYPIETLPYQLNLNSSNKDNDFPLFDIVLLLENIHDINYINDLKVNVIFSFLRTSHNLEGEIKYNSCLYKKNTLEQIIICYQRLMEVVLFNLDITAHQIDILSKEEKHRLLFDLNETRQEYPGDQTLDELFLIQVSITPDKISVVYGDSNSDDSISLSYRQLNERSSYLSSIIERKGVKSGDIVGIMAERSAETIIGILAILKSGGAYLPLDPKMQEERLVYMLDDSCASLLLARNSVLEKYSFTSIQGLREKSVHPLVTAARPAIKKFDHLPHPDRSLIDFKKYSPHISLAMVKNCITLQATRGCPYNCVYCAKLWPKKHVVRSALNIFTEIKTYYDIGFRKFAFIDDVFNLDIENSKAFFRLIIENGLNVQLLFPTGLRGDILTKDYIDLMVKAGTIHISLALETASPRLQKLIGKNLKIEKLLDSAQYICEKYPHVILDLFTMHGFPTETQEEALMTLNFIKSLKWLHFPLVNIIKIYPNTDMEKMALQNGITHQSIQASEKLAWHELSDTLPFSRDFTLKYQSDFLKDYFLLKERLLHVLPFQMKLLSEDELVQKYNSYLPNEIGSFDQLLEFIGISREELGVDHCLNEEKEMITGINWKLKENLPTKNSSRNALKVILIDLSQSFSCENKKLDELWEPPLGLIYLMTSLKKQWGSKVEGKIAKSGIDFDNYQELKELLSEFKPDLVGIRTLTFYKDFFHKTTALIKQWLGNIPIISGGPYATNSYMTLLNDGNVDVVVLGEGELTLNEMIGKILENDGKLPGENILKKIPGIAFVPGKNKKGNSFARDVIQLGLQNFSKGNIDWEPHKRQNSSAYVIYTSGSTGNPKGVIMEHRNAVNVVTWFSRQYNVHVGTQVMQLSDYTFDASVNQIFASLLHGATLHVVKRELLLNIDKMRQYIDTHYIQLINFVPMMIRELFAKGKRLESIETIISGGERLDESLKDELLAKGYQLYNQYGPTETTIDALMEKCSKERVSLGYPIANARCYILDKNNNLLPYGVPGELCIGGDGVAMGYLNNPELTEEKFIGMSLLNQERIFKTGDLVRYLPKGNIEFLGRRDQQVKIRGFRVELGEIENQLLKYEAIKDAVVIDRKSQEGEHWLCAYIVPHNLTELDSWGSIRVNELKVYLERKLPSYMVPLNFIPIKNIPLKTNGKVNRNILETIEIKNIPTGVKRAPVGELEKTLAALWSEVLGIEAKEVDMDSNFFELGGHSLKAIKLMTAIHERLNAKLSLAQLFSGPSIGELAACIREAGEDLLVSLKPVGKRAFYPLSSAQKRLYILNRMAPESVNYNSSTVVKLEGNLEPMVLDNIFRKLLQRHESFRTAFVLEKGEPVQKIYDRVEFKIESHDPAPRVQRIKHNKKHHLPPSELISNTIKDFIRPFELSQAPLLRVGMIKMEIHQYIVIMDMHHIITDGVSKGILIQEIIDLYRGIELKPLPLSYKDYVVWQEREGHKEIIKRQGIYWSKKFSSRLPRLNLPIDYPRPEKLSFQGKRLDFTLEEPVVKKLKLLAAEENATMYMILLALFSLLLSRVSGQDDIIVGTDIAGRNHRDLEKIVGLFVNTLAIRNFPSGEKSFRDFLREVKLTILEAFENQDYPFENLIHQISIPRDADRNPLFDVMFSLNNIEYPEINLPGLKLNRIQKEDDTTKFDLILSMLENEDQVFSSFEYCTKLFKVETIQRFIGYFKEIGASVVKNPDAKLLEIEMVSEEEEKYLLKRIQEDEEEYPGEVKENQCKTRGETQGEFDF